MKMHLKLTAIPGYEVIYYYSPSLRPILAERDSDHDQRADYDRHRADKRHSSSTPTMAARTRRVLFICAKRQPATLGHLRLAPAAVV
jgi:hypothetical protein